MTFASKRDLRKPTKVSKKPKSKKITPEMKNLAQDFTNLAKGKSIISTKTEVEAFQKCPERRALAPGAATFYKKHLK